MDLNSLLQKARNLSNNIEKSHDLPPIDRTFPQVLSATEEMHSRVTRTGSKDLQAHLLLGSKGVDLTQITNKLNSLSAHGTKAPFDSIHELDVQGYLKDARENAILSIIDETNRDLYKMQDKQKWEVIYSEWRQEKLRILNSFVGTSEDMLQVDRLKEERIIEESSLPNSKLSRIEMLFATEVMEYNKLITTSIVTTNLMEKFSNVVQSLDDSQLFEMWSIMQYMVQVSNIPAGLDPIVYRHQTSDFIRQAKRYLETRYKRYMTSIITSSSQPAERGGKPTPQSLVKAFVTVTTLQRKPDSTNTNDMFEGCPLWQLVYYCLRCGDIVGALDFIKRSNKELSDLERVFEEKLRAPDKEINSLLAAQLRVYYTDKVKNTSDPYQKAVYCIVLGCDKYAAHDVVAPTIDDFLWIQLSLVENSDHDCDYRTEKLSYANLQSLVLEKYGEGYFNAREQINLYFSVLALTGQFEAAIEFLVRKKAYQVHAVHMAIALNELGLLAGPEDVQKPLLSTNSKDSMPMCRLNLPRLVLLYVKNFETIDIKEALHYYYFLRNFKDCEGRNLFLVCVYDLVIDTGAYKLVLGQRDSNIGGKVVGGLFEQFSTNECTTQNVTKMVADDLVRRGALELSIQLYDMAGDYTKAVRQLILLLSQVVHLPQSENSTQARLAKVTEDFFARMSAHQIELDASTGTTLRIFKHILDFFNCYNNRNYRSAGDHLAQTKIIPMSMDDVDECVLKFKKLSADVCKVFPDVILAAMNIVYAEYKSLQKSEQHVAHLDFLRQKAKAITTMAATVPYRMPGDTNKRIVQMEILMN